MKKILFMLAVLVTMTAVQSQAQVRDVRNTFLITKTDVAGNDTVKIVPASYETIVYHTLTDSVKYKVRSVAQSVIGDKLTFIIKGAAGAVKFTTIQGSEFKVTGADSVITSGSGKYAVISFIYNGSFFVEQSKIAQ